jgi:CobQ-like glutamine amidotransferase family enzyme
MSKQLHIVHLYPDEMNTYGDRGNIITLLRRTEWYGFEPVLHYHHPGKPFPKQAELLFGGGGQDSAQSEIQQDILVIGDKLRQLTEAGTPMLMICGMYQLFGHRFVTHSNEEIKGIGIFDIETRATKHRLIGNIAVESKAFGTLYGFENHSGQTYLGAGQQPLGSVLRGNGNNDQDKLEGARRDNIIGSYMHGPMLPLNPRLADWLLLVALQRAHGIEKLPKTLDDTYAQRARVAAKGRAY